MIPRPAIALAGLIAGFALSQTHEALTPKPDWKATLIASGGSGLFCFPGNSCLMTNMMVTLSKPAAGPAITIQSYAP